MAIHVICPGCMARFEVSDRFAGKKGPCPKCGHIIEIPKANVVITSPDELVVDGKKVQNPDHIRPIEQKTYSFAGRAIWVNLAVIAGVLLIASLARLCFPFFLALPVGILLGGVLAFPLMKYGYMTFRNPDDLEIFLGGQLGIKSLFGAIGLILFWLLYELIVWYLNPGGMALAYLVPVAVLAAFLPMLIFDMSFADSLAVSVVFVLAAILLRGIIFSQEGGWVWERRFDTVQTAPALPASGPADAEESEMEEENTDAVSEDAGADSDSEPAAPSSGAKVRHSRPKLDSRAPDPSKFKRGR